MTASLAPLFGRDLGWRITHFDPPRAMVLENWGAGLTFAAFELPHFIMQRRMMLGIKERAERVSRDDRRRRIATTRFQSQPFNARSATVRSDLHALRSRNISHGGGNLPSTPDLVRGSPRSRLHQPERSRSSL